MKDYRERLIKGIKSAPNSGGKTQLLRHLKGDKLTRNQAIRAKCADCCCYFVDGRVNCEMPDCPLYPYMPYKAVE